MNRTGRRKSVTAAALAVVAIGMIGLSFASVPLYRLFCEVTGFAGTPRTEDVRPADRVADATVTVRFDANVNSALPWSFAPAQRQVTARLGQEVMAFYKASNLSDVPVTGTATFNVTPEKAARYFNKIECFCFSEQTLAPGESVAMPVAFYVDPALTDGIDARDVRKITLSYTFFRVGSEKEDRGDKPVAAAGPRARES